MLHIVRHERGDPARNQYYVHRHECDEMLFILSGQGVELLDDDQRRGFGKHELFYYPAGRPHNSYSLSAVPYVCYVITFKAAVLTEVLRAGSGPGEALARLEAWARQGGESRLPLPERAGGRVENLLHQLYARQQGNQPNRDWARRLVFEELLLLLDEQVLGKPAARRVRTAADLVAEACAFIRVRYRDDITVDDVLSICPLSRSHFHAVFKAETGQTFVAFLTQERLAHAAELLCGSDLPITHIAYDCGFHSYSHFCYIFRKHRGLAPSDYRRGAAGAAAPTRPKP